MTCPGDGSTGPKFPNWEFQNWSRTRIHNVQFLFKPEPPNVTQQLVAIVEAAEKAGGVVKAIGSQWSYPDVAIAPEVTHAINTDSLKNILSGDDPTEMDKVIPFALNDTNRANHKHFVHVEAGIKIYDLNCQLNDRKLAMKTLGGSNGQSLGGAISTGTHGSNFDMPPLADVVRAMHLVGPGGQEWWIERSGNLAITDPERMSQARNAGLLCSDIRIEYDNLLFAAVLVSMGRMGIIHSYVVEVEDAFRLKQEQRQKLPWQGASTIIRQLRDSQPYKGPEFIEVIINPYKTLALRTSLEGVHVLWPGALAEIP